MPLDMSISKTFGPGTGVEVTGLLAVWYAHTHAPECSPRLSWGKLVSTVADTGQYSAVPGIRMAGGRLQLKVTTNWAGFLARPFVSGLHRPAYWRHPIQPCVYRQPGCDSCRRSRRKWRRLALPQIGKCVDAFERGRQLPPSDVHQKHQVMEPLGRRSHKSDIDRDNLSGHYFV